MTPLASFAILTACVLWADVEVTVTGQEKAAPLAVVTAPLPDHLAGQHLSLVDSASNKEVPVQEDVKDGKPAFTFILQDLNPSEKRSFVLKESATASKANVVVEKSEAGADVHLQGEFFTSYQTHNGPKPYLWPIIGPTGKPMTRAFPMDRTVKGELRDHIHHRGLWFTFDKVNGQDFWAETPTSGKSIHAEFVSMTSGPVFGELVSKVDWQTRKGAPVATDTRRYRFYAVEGARLFDFSIEMRGAEGELKFGDSKEGLFAIRVNEQMKLQRKDNPGSILNSAGQKDGEAWGKRAEWCAYFGKIDGDPLGIAIFDAPTNFRHPTYWHVRDYGLFAANPFGVSVFTGDSSQNGSHTVPAGSFFIANYRVYIHKGDPAAGQVADWFAAYAAPPIVTVKSK